MVETVLFSMAAVLIIQRLVELRIAARNRRYILEHGGQEFNPEHYPLFLLLHTGWFISWMYEAVLINQLNSSWLIWLGLFVMAQGLRYWCITSLGRCWNTRILIIPGKKRIQQGPYRLIPHPNYLAVCLELACVPLMFGAVATAIIASLLNAILLIGIRIPAEEKALQQLR
jgi:methyltransferase